VIDLNVTGLDMRQRRSLSTSVSMLTIKVRFIDYLCRPRVRPDSKIGPTDPTNRTPVFDLRRTTVLNPDMQLPENQMLTVSKPVTLIEE